MNYNGLGFDFSNLQTCTLYKKGRMFTVVLIILFTTFLAIGGSFLLIYLSDGTVTVNGTPMSASDPNYDRFFTTFLIIMFSVALFFLLLTIVSIVFKAKPYLYMDNDDLNSTSFYYLPKANVYLTEEYAIKYNAYTKKVKVIKNYNDIQKLFVKYIPWQGIVNFSIKDINHKEKITIVKVKYPNSYLTRIYKFSNEINIVPISFSSSDVYITGMSRKTTGLSRYNFDLINRAQRFEIHPEIKKELHSLRQTM